MIFNHYGRQKTTAKDLCLIVVVLCRVQVGPLSEVYRIIRSNVHLVFF